VLVSLALRRRNRGAPRWHLIPRSARQRGAVGVLDPDHSPHSPDCFPARPRLRRPRRARRAHLRESSPSSRGPRGRACRRDQRSRAGRVQSRVLRAPVAPSSLLGRTTTSGPPASRRGQRLRRPRLARCAPRAIRAGAHSEIRAVGAPARGARVPAGTSSAAQPRPDPAFCAPAPRRRRSRAGPRRAAWRRAPVSSRCVVTSR
jgi:hypothetical protein